MRLAASDMITRRAGTLEELVPKLAGWRTRADRETGRTRAVGMGGHGASPAIFDRCADEALGTWESIASVLRM